MSTTFNTEEKQIGGDGSGGYGLRSLPQKRRRQSLAGGAGGAGGAGVGGDGESEEMHQELVRKEIEKIRRAREHERQHDRLHGNMVQKKMNDDDVTRYINSCDITGEEFRIVCEELWIDFKLWVSHHKNLTNSACILRSAVSRNLYAILFVSFSAVLFRWYVGGGRDACLHGLGYGVFNFMCELLRYFGEIVVILLLSIIGFCVGLLPFVIGVIICEFDSAFPRGEYGDEEGEEDEDSKDTEGEDTEGEDGGNHLKKE